MFEKELKDIKEKIDIEMKIKTSFLNCPSEIKEAVEYSFLSEGKRVRPILFLKTYEALKGEYDINVLKFSLSLEMIHSYSLIHDDLPSLDNDDYRRGELTNHKVFGEAMAILSGDSLLNLAYENMFEIISENNENCIKYIEASKVISKAVGIEGMIGGQVKDILSDGKEIDEEELKYIQKNKTTKLIESSVKAGAIVAGANKREIEELSRYGEILGDMFQIKDDILDVIGDMKKMGKSVGTDINNNRLTHTTVYGLEDSVEKVNNLYKESIEIIDNLNLKKSYFLKELSKYLAYREN